MRTQIRLALRHTLRTPWRSAIVVLLVALPVGALATGIQSVARSGEHHERSMDAVFGRAEVKLTGLDAVDKTGLPDKTEFPEGEHLLRSRSGTLAVATEEEQPGIETAEVLSWEEVDLGDDMMDGRLELRSGRLPRAPGEAVIVGELPRVLGATAHRLPVALPRTELRVVGAAAEQPYVDGMNFLSRRDLFVAPGTMPERVDPVWTKGVVTEPPIWYSTMTATDAAELASPVMMVGSRIEAPVLVRQSLLVLGSTLAFAWCTAVAASALAIGARSRRRELGLLTLNGASPKWLRRSITADGGVLGVLGAALGLIAALTISVTVLGYMSVSPMILTAGLMGFLAAVMAGHLGAREIIRQSPVDLLAGRSPRYGTAPRWLATGLVAFALCALLVVFSDSVDPIAGIVAVLCGVVSVICVSTGVIRVLPALGAHAPVTLRIALRDLARFGSRTAGASAAIAVTLAVATVGATAEYSLQRTADVEANRAEGNSTSQAATGSSGSTEAGRGTVVEGTSFRLIDGRLDIQQLRSGQLTSAQVERLAQVATAKGAVTRTVQVARGDHVQACASNTPELLSELGVDTESMAGAAVSAGCTPATVVRADDFIRSGLSAHQNELLDQGEVIARLSLPQGFESAAFQALEPVVSIREQVVPVAELADGSDVAANSGEVTGVLDSLGGFVAAVVPESRWSDLVGEDTTALTALTAGGMNTADWNELLGVTASITNRAYGIPAPSSDDWSTQRIVAVAAGFVLIVLAILALALMLVRIESKEEERILCTQGATPRRRAEISAWRAAVLTFVAAVPAVAVTTLVTVIISRDAERLLYPRPATAGFIVLGIPVLAAVVFGVTALRPTR